MKLKDSLYELNELFIKKFPKLTKYKYFRDNNRITNVPNCYLFDLIKYYDFTRLDNYEDFYVYYCNKYDILIMFKSEISEPYVKYARKGYIFDNWKIYTYIIYKGNFYYTTQSERIACQRIFRLLKK